VTNPTNTTSPTPLSDLLLRLAARTAEQVQEDAEQDRLVEEAEQADEEAAEDRRWASFVSSSLSAVGLAARDHKERREYNA
jgi:hypothetical protein